MTSSEASCLLCLSKNEKTINFYSDAGKRLNIISIVSSHFWFNLDEMNTVPNICYECLNKIESFHEFYESVQIAHKKFETVFVKIEKDLDIEESEEMSEPEQVPHANIKIENDLHIEDYRESYHSAQVFQDKIQITNNIKDDEDDESSNTSVCEIPNINSIDTESRGNSSAAMIDRNLSKPEGKVAARQRLMKEKQVAKHSVKEECGCSKMCSDQIPHDRRVAINKKFNEYDSISKKLFIRSQVKQHSRQEQRKFAECYLNDAMEQPVRVCQKFFLSTLGFNPNNNTMLRNALKTEFPIVDKRGKYLRKNQLTESIVVEHIMSFNPETSHRRRENAPHRLYLPSDVNIVKMHSLLNESKPEMNCSYDYYRKIVDRMNISFAKLGHEKCEDCERFEQDKHSHSTSGCEAMCAICAEHDDHKIKYEKARMNYEADKLLPFDAKHVRASTDLEKVIMSPRMEQFKEVLFTKRICVYNQTFAPLGSCKNVPVFACLWHEAIAGRKNEEIISCYHAFLLKYRDAEEITLWCDNGCSQNKSWALFTFLVYIINSNEIAANCINIKYLHKGHTFMSAHSFHHQVELSMKNRLNGCVYDFVDFIEAVQMASSGRITCKEMHFFDFADWPDWCSLPKVNKCEPRPCIDDFTKLMFQRGKKVMYYANDFDDDYQQFDFIMELTRPQPRTTPKGVDPEIKSKIVENLTHLMPPNRRYFWENL